MGADEDEIVARLGGQMKGLHEYATTKAMGERAVLEASKEGEDGEEPLSTCAVAPHQVYGPSDRLFLPALIRTAKKGALFVMGSGANHVSFTHESNIAHALTLAAGAMAAHVAWVRAGSPEISESHARYARADEHTQGRLAARVVGEYMVVTDSTEEYPAGMAINLWDAIDDATSKAGLGSIRKGARGFFKLPYYGLLLPIAQLGRAFTALTGKFVNITPFTIRMLVIDRFFDIGKAYRLLGYTPLVTFRDPEGWEAAIDAAVARVRREDKW